eukprot:scaffold648_cov131-Skeletonema_menzelii.AAC.1
MITLRWRLTILELLEATNKKRGDSGANIMLFGGGRRSWILFKIEKASVGSSAVLQCPPMRFPVHDGDGGSRRSPGDRNARLCGSRGSTLEQRGVGDRTDPYEYAHAVVGTISTAVMILQPLLMSIMRKPENEAEHANFKNWPLSRQIGHVSHRALGFVSIYLAFVAMETGTHLSESRAQKWSAGLIATITATVLVTLTITHLGNSQSTQEIHDHDVKVELGEAR